MKTSQNGFLFIADITGYTSFLSHSELEHAEDSLRTLIDLLIEQTKLPLVISRLEGDAVISYAPEGSFLQGQTLVEMIESAYVAFRGALELMVLNTTCTCNACRNIPNLDLKFFIHHGTFMLQPLPAYTELIGTDVNLLHRLTKNSVGEKTGIKAYVMYSQAAIDALGISEITDQMKLHVESYEHIGEVKTYIQDMHPIWERERGRLRTVVEPEDAAFIVEDEFPLERAFMWDYLTKPEYRAILTGAISNKVQDRTNGRIGTGASYQCAHGKNTSIHTIVDWQPFEQYTIEILISSGVSGLSTTRLTPIEKGTKVTVLISKCKGGSLILRAFFDIMGRLTIPNGIKKGLMALKAQIEKEFSEGVVVRPISVEIPKEEIKKAVAESLETH